MPKLNELIKQQVSVGEFIRRCVTNLKKKGNITEQKVRARLELLDSYWKQFSERHWEIVSIAESEEKDYCQLGTYEEIEELYIEQKAELNELLVPGKTSGSTGCEQNPISQNKSFGSHAKLPKLPLPKFDGTTSNWESFRDLFTSLVADSKEITNVDKLQYLNAALVGEPAQLLKNVPITASNWSSTWAALKDKYDDKGAILNSYLDQILSLTVASSESASELKRIWETIEESRRGLTNMNRPVQHWDDWFVFITVSRLDKTTRKAWEIDRDSREIPTFEQISKFMNKRIRALDAVVIKSDSKQIELKQNKFHANKRFEPEQPKKRVIANPSRAINTNRNPVPVPAPTVLENKKSCFMCKADHLLIHCPTFKSSSAPEKLELIKRLSLCFNCFGRHSLRDCTNIFRCLICKKKHHTLIHDSFIEQDRPEPEPSGSGTGTVGATPCRTIIKNHRVLLATVKVIVIGQNGHELSVKALLDPAAETSFVSEYIVQQLSINRRRVDLQVEGIGGAKPKPPKSIVTMNIRAIGGNQDQNALQIDAYVLKNVLASRQSTCIPWQDWSHLNNLDLADPDYANGRTPEMILGISVYVNIIRAGIVRGPPGTPIAQETAFGWIIHGNVQEGPEPDRCLNVPCLINSSLSDQLREFWELEELKIETPLSEEDQFCEDLFRTTHKRTETGQYVVRLPLRPNVELGQSRPRAMHCLTYSERRRTNDQSLDQAYCSFMEEYENLNHMKEVEPNESANFLPHHAVWKGDKIRVVFNAASKTTSGHSLNDLLMTGARLQLDIDDVLLNWRRYKFVFTADIVKMFRGILVHPDDQNYQRILWRRTMSAPVKEFLLLTVTYGTAFAPWAAIRTLKQLAEDEKENYPLGAEILLKERYVDDFFSGDDTEKLCTERMNNLVGILKAGGFELSKWAVNLPNSIAEPYLPVLHEIKTSDVKTLGIFWNNVEDTFGYKINLDERIATTRRAVLSQIARIYDPLGWLTPIMITAKIFMQKLWILHEEWDSPLPEKLAEEWQTFYEQLNNVETIKVPRWIELISNTDFELHGFCDSSEMAYAATVFIRIPSSDQVHLLISKSKVTPIKTVTIPRLELCAASLLARLLNKVVKTFQLNNSDPPLFAWTDSAVVLAWLRGHPSQWRNFVANRVSDIHQRLPNVIWRHVRSAENPADHATRGMTCTELKQCEQWWHGPIWLRESAESWPVSNVDHQTELELNRKVVVSATTVNPDELAKFSSLTPAIRKVAWLFRAFRNTRTKVTGTERTIGPLNADELNFAENYWVKKTQIQYFANERRAILDEKPIEKGRLRGLRAILDEDGIIRLGGRLNKSELTYSERHPIVIPAESTLGNLLIQRAHVKTLHGGAQLTLSHLHRSFWLLNGRTHVKRFVKNCVKCFRFKAKPMNQLIGQLPSVRCTTSRPFLHSGVDYAGPINIRTTKGRGYKSYKGYIVLFVCMVTRAVHLEAASDLTSDGFVAAFRRFVARRGLVQNLYSDNATNFKGARTLFDSMFTEAQADAVIEYLSNERVNWTFIPPRAPHMGGLWEAGIKSTKYHLRRVLGDSTLTFEEMSTLLSQIEACLNSRPISAMSSEPDDLNALTPGHFLVGHALTALPEPSLLDTNPGRLTRWKLVQQRYQNFWERWYKEYLVQMNARAKWSMKKKNLQVNDLVLVLDDDLPPTKWSLGRVVATYPGADGLVRVVDVRFGNGVKRRPIVKLARLPVEVSSD